MQSLTNAISYSYYIWVFFWFFFRCIFAYDNQTRSYCILFFPPVHWCFLAVWYTTLAVSQCGVFRMLFISFKQSKYLGDYESIKILTMIAKLCKTLFFLCQKAFSKSASIKSSEKTKLAVWTDLPRCHRKTSRQSLKSAVCGGVCSNNLKWLCF